MGQAIFFSSTLFAIFALAMQRPPEAADPPSPTAPASLSIQGVGLQQTSVTSSDLATMPRRTVTIKDKDEAEVRYEGVTVHDLLSKAGMKFGQSMRGTRLRDFLLAESADDYGVIFAIPELTDEFSDGVVLVADRANGAPITGRDGPLRLIATQDKKHARWVRNVASLTIQSAPAR
ncbi:MAG: molybdopterin-dependent oxidoreductase [Phycisphaerales bacterium]|nr:molybdopterin-dependent oxidoreductase [Phycisphaerales bacterium]